INRATLARQKTRRNSWVNASQPRPRSSFFLAAAGSRAQKRGGREGRSRGAKSGHFDTRRFGRQALSQHLGGFEDRHPHPLRSRRKYYSRLLRKSGIEV